MWQRLFFIISVVILTVIHFLGKWDADYYWLYAIAGPLFLLGTYDCLQTKRVVLRNYPLIGHLRYMLLEIRPQIRQYFIESDKSGRPFNREARELVVNRAHQTLDELPFGTQSDVYQPGYDFISHSMKVVKVDEAEARVLIGNDQCENPYVASRLNVSAMSFGALSRHAIRALNRGAKRGNYYHNTGEGGLSPYHLQEGGDIVWQIGTGYFGCRTKEGGFDEVEFESKASHTQVKMIEIKISQGAKPGHGGILPGVKVSEEIAAIRGLEPHKDAISPPCHSEFSTPIGLLEFVVRLRKLSGGKPVGFKLCIGQRAQFLAICKAMLKTQIYPDFITVDGGEGGTGAAPVEYSDSVGMPLNDALLFVHNSLVGTNLRDKIRIIASGKIISGFDMVSKMALGADLCNSARGMLFSIGCIQSRRCHTNTCPTGIATQDKRRFKSLDIEDKANSAYHFHQATIQSFRDVLGVSGHSRVADLSPSNLQTRYDYGEIMSFDEVYQYLKPGELLTDDLPDHFSLHWSKADAHAF